MRRESALCRQCVPISGRCRRRQAELQQLPLLVGRRLGPWRGLLELPVLLYARRLAAMRMAAMAWAQCPAN